MNDERCRVTTEGKDVGPLEGPGACCLYFFWFLLTHICRFIHHHHEQWRRQCTTMTLCHDRGDATGNGPKRHDVWAPCMLCYCSFLLTYLCIGLSTTTMNDERRHHIDATSRRRGRTTVVQARVILFFFMLFLLTYVCMSFYHHHPEQRTLPPPRCHATTEGKIDRQWAQTTHLGPCVFFLLVFCSFFY